MVSGLNLRKEFIELAYAGLFRLTAIPQDRLQPVLMSALNLELHGELCCLSISRGISDIKMTQRELVGASASHCDLATVT